MVELYGKHWSRQELTRYTGQIDQLGGVSLGDLGDGRERDVRTATLDTGSGLSVQVLLDRGMDIGMVKFKGAPLTWRSPVGAAHPTYYEPTGTGWLRTFHAGMLVTCGLTSAGAVSVDEGEALGLHGRISTLPAERVWADGSWRDDTYEMWVRGMMRQAVLFGENLTLTRRIWANLGESRFSVRDVVSNEGTTVVPHMMLYHCNYGFPLLAKGAELIAPSTKVTPRDAVAAAGLATHATYEAPQDGYAEQCFYHDMQADTDGMVKLVLANHNLNQGQGMGLMMRYRQAELPFFTQWKMVGASTYITGLEPGNCHVEGRAHERELGTLQYLEPGESREYLLEFTVLADNAAIEQALQ